MVKNDLELLFEKGERTTERRINGQIDDDEFLKQKHSTPALFFNDNVTC